ncbi:hypothetical protein MTO96_013395 [Rhipicephalus appendiculatus]
MTLAFLSTEARLPGLIDSIARSRDKRKPSYRPLAIEAWDGADVEDPRTGQPTVPVDERRDLHRALV